MARKKPLPAAAEYHDMMHSIERQAIIAAQVQLQIGCGRVPTAPGLAELFLAHGRTKYAYDVYIQALSAAVSKLQEAAGG